MPQAVADVIQRLSMLPPFPKVTSKLLSMLQDETVSVDQLAGVISTDPSLAMKVIHLSNSPFYMASRQVESVRDAVLILGVSSIKNITAGISVQKGLETIQPHAVTFDMFGFWKHSYATAIVAHKLGSMRNRTLGDTMYLTGLIHDVGKLIIAHFWPEVWRAIINTRAQTGEPYSVIEARLSPTSHASLASELFHKWSFPPSIVTMVGQHHDDASEANGDAGILASANALVNQCGHVFPAGPLPPQDPVMFDRYQDVVRALDEDLEYQLRMLAS